MSANERDLINSVGSVEAYERGMAALTDDEVALIWDTHLREEEVTPEIRAARAKFYEAATAYGTDQCSEDNCTHPAYAALLFVGSPPPALKCIPHFTLAVQKYAAHRALVDHDRAYEGWSAADPIIPIPGMQPHC